MNYIIYFYLNSGGLYVDYLIDYLCIIDYLVVYWDYGLIFLKSLDLIDESDKNS